MSPSRPRTTAALLALLLSLLVAPGSGSLRAAPDEPKRDAPKEAPAGVEPPAPEPGDAPDRAAREKKLIEAFRDRCETLIDDNNFDSKTTAHYIVETDDPRIEVKEAAALLDSFRGFFDSYWTGKIALRPYEDKSFVFLFYSYYKYKQLLGDASAAGEIRPVGHYMGMVDVVALHTDTVGAADLPNILLHEAAHQLIGKRIFGDDSHGSPWLSEGLASYFGNTLRDKSGAFQPGKIGGKEGVVFFPKARGGRAIEASESLDRYRTKLRRGEAGPLVGVVAITTPDEFYSGDPIENYAAAWLLVHFMMHADGGAHAAAFVTYMKHEAEAAGGATAFYRDIGMTPDALQAAFDDYVSHLSAR